MSLRVRLVLMFGGLLAVFMAAQWMLIRNFSIDLSSEIDHVAFSMGREVISTFSTNAHGFENHDVNVKATDENSDRHQVSVLIVAKPDEENNQMRVRKEIQWVQNDEVWADERVTQSDIAPGENSFEIATIDLFVDSDTQDNAEYLVMKSPLIERRIPIPKGGVRDAVGRVSQRMVLGSLTLFLAGLLAVGFVSHRVSAPLRELSQAAQLVGSGAIGTQVATGRYRGEEASAIDAFNHMSLRLQEFDEESRMLRQRQALSELGEIARGLAHTIRNPLNAIGLSMDQLAALAKDQVTASEIAHAGRRQIRRVDQWIRSFLALASDGGEMVQDVDVAVLVQEVVLNAAQDNPGKVEFKLDLSPKLAKVSGLVPELRAAIHALLINAIEASPQNGRVSLCLIELDDRIRLQIDDEGAGVASHLKDRLFTPHVTTKSHGSGMGLFLARRIMNSKYGGDVTLESRSDKGARATLTLPFTGRNS